jgi:hypothetical protein
MNNNSINILSRIFKELYADYIGYQTFDYLKNTIFWDDEYENHYKKSTLFGINSITYDQWKNK